MICVYCFSESVSNFEVENSENLDNAFYFSNYVFWHGTSKNVKGRVILILKKNVKTYSRTMLPMATFALVRTV